MTLLGLCFFAPWANAQTTSTATPAPATAAPAPVAGPTLFTGIGYLNLNQAGFGYVDFNGYWDTRNGFLMTVNTFATFAHRFSYFAFLDIDNHFSPTYVGDTTEYYTEHNLNWAPSANVPIDLQAQLAMGSGNGFEIEDTLRFGARWRPNMTPSVGSFLERMHTWVQLTWFPLVQGIRFRTPTSWLSQVSVYYRSDLHDRVYLQGWADFDFAAGGPSSGFLGALTEHQIGLRIVSNFYAVAEFRYHYVAPPGMQVGLGVGLEWRFNFRTDHGL
jgi:hypothetical protein